MGSAQSNESAPHSAPESQPLSPPPEVATTQSPQSPQPKPDAVMWRIGPGMSLKDLGLGRPQFEEQIGDVGPFLQLYREGPWIIVENISSFALGILPQVRRGRFLRGDEEGLSQVLEPGETYQLRFSTDEEHYRMGYESHLPHFVCDGISKRVDPTEIQLICQPAARDSDGWYFMSGKDGVGRPEVWLVYIDFAGGADTKNGCCDCYVKHQLIQTCTFLDTRRPARRVDLPLQEIRFCQDSCGQEFRDGRSLKSTVQQLKQGQVTVAELGIRVVALESVHFALDNRRLKCVKSAFPPSQSIPVLLVDLREPRIKEEWDSKFTAGKRIPTHEEARQMDLAPQNSKGKGKGKGKKGRGKPRGKRENRP